MGLHEELNRDMVNTPMGESVSSSAETDAITPGPDRHWFVAIDDVDVGPIDIAEVEARWRAGELNSDSLAWRPPMAEWQAIALIPELSYLAQLEQPTPEEPTLPDVQWVMGNAASLSDLVAMELEAADIAPAITPASTHSIFDDTNNMGLPDLGSLGFGNDRGGRSHQHHHWDTGWGVPLDGDATPFPRGPTPWLEAHHDDHGKRKLMGILIGGGFLVLTLGLVLAIIELVRGPRPAVMPIAASAPASTAQPPIASPALQPVAPEPTAELTPVPVAAPEVAPEPPKPTPKPPPVTPKPVTPKPKPVAPKPKPAPEPKPPPEPKRHTKKMILAGIKSNAPNLMPCLRAARAKGEVTAGRIRLVLDWTIEADGTVSRPKLKGPARVMRTSLPRCFAAQMRTWKFPEASRSSNVRNFGLPINLK